MAKICISEKTASRQRWIEDGLLELMLENKFEQITVAELCRHLSLARRSFYRYFTDIDDVLDSLMNHAFQDMAAPNSGLSIQELECNYRFWYQHKLLLTALANSGMTAKITEYAMKYADEEALKKYLVSYDLGMDISRESNLFVVTGMASLLISWHEEGYQKTPEQMAQIAYRMLSAPILRGK